MKIIKSFAVIIVGLCATTLLHAQQIKTDIAKPLEVKIQVIAGNKTSPQPVLKPQPQAAEAQAPSTSAIKAEPQTNEKLEVKTFNKNDLATPGGEEGKKILNGNASRPKDAIYSPSTADANQTHPVVKPTKSSQQQQ